jgi:hypothetical protein
MKKYEDYILLAPAYSDEYKQWLKDRGIENKEDKNDRALQWIDAGLGHCADHFELTPAEQYKALFRFQLLLLDQYGIKQTEHIESVQRELLTWVYANLDKAEWKDKKRYGILTKELEAEWHEFYDQCDAPLEEGGELTRYQKMTQKPVTIQDEEPEESSNVVTLKPTKRASIIDV